MTLNVFEDSKSLRSCLRVIIFAEKPQAAHAVLIHQRIDAFHRCFQVIIHCGSSLTPFLTAHKWFVDMAVSTELQNSTMRFSAQKRSSSRELADMNATCPPRFGVSNST